MPGFPCCGPGGQYPKPTAEIPGAIQPPRQYRHSSLLMPALLPRQPGATSYAAFCGTSFTPNARVIFITVAKLGVEPDASPR